MVSGRPGPARITLHSTRYGVDLYLCGHEHNYERMYDIAPDFNILSPWTSGKTTQSTVDMPATTYIVTGAAGGERQEKSKWHYGVIDNTVYKCLATFFFFFSCLKEKK